MGILFYAFYSIFLSVITTHVHAAARSALKEPGSLKNVTRHVQFALEEPTVYAVSPPEQEQYGADAREARKAVYKHDRTNPHIPFFMTPAGEQAAAEAWGEMKYTITMPLEELKELRKQIIEELKRLREAKISETLQFSGQQQLSPEEFKQFQKVRRNQSRDLQQAIRDLESDLLEVEMSIKYK